MVLGGALSSPTRERFPFAAVDMADDSIPPRPECDFDFNLPQGMNAEEGIALTLGSAGAIQNVDTLMDEDPMPDRDLDALFVGDAVDAQQPMNYEMFSSGFSDDEGGEQAFDRSWAAQQAKKASLKDKKSPRRSEGRESGEKANPRTKRPRKSLFGGPFEEVDDHQEKVDKDNPDLEADTPETSGPNIRNRMSSLDLDQQQVEDVEDIQEAQDTRPFDMGFDLISFDQDDMPPRLSRALSEDSPVIPPDNQVSLQVKL
jgi:hypothetical protein